MKGRSRSGAMGERIWLGRAVSPMVATSPGQRPGERTSRLIHSAFRGMPRNATRLGRVTSFDWCYAPEARGIFEPYGSKMPNVLFNAIAFPGRCPGLGATIGLTARHNHYYPILRTRQAYAIRPYSFTSGRVL